MKRERSGVESFTIEAQGERARIVPQFGCQCLGYRVGSLDVIAGPATLDELFGHPHRFGIPILFPWPGRIAQGRFSWNGVEHHLPINEPARGHSIHGLVCERPFAVIRRGPYYINCRLDSALHPALAAIWPYPFTLELDYEVGNGLRLRATVCNVGDRPMPFGFGIHPYLHAPLDPNGSHAAMIVEVPAALHRIVDADMIPTGESVPVAGKFDLRHGRPLGAETYDDVFHQLSPESDRSFRARLIDPALRIAAEVRADSSFGDWVVYAPADRSVVAIEPYTCAPDAFNLAARGIESGVRELAPNQSWSGSIEIRLSAP